jgi:predicted MarR family transcription regulator
LWNAKRSHFLNETNRFARAIGKTSTRHDIVPGKSATRFARQGSVRRELACRGGTALRHGRRTELPTAPADSDTEFSAQLSEFEFAHLTFAFGFLRWVEKCMEATGLRGLTAVDILVLHAVNLRARGRRLSEISMVLNVDDSHLVAYSLKKLVSAELVQVIKDGRESRYETTTPGDEACDSYRAVRKSFLVRSVRTAAHASAGIEDMTMLLTALTGVYDQATRMATANSADLAKRPPVRTKR